MHSRWWHDDEDADHATSAVTFNATAGTIYRIAVDGYNFDDGRGADSGNVRIAVLDNRPAAATSMVAAVAPNARTTRVGTAVTGFATIINASSVAATSCSIAQPQDVPAAFLYQTTNPATNTPTGSPNVPVNIAAGQAQTFFFAINPTAAFSRDIPLIFKCANSNPAAVVAGLNTFLVTASATAIPDMLSIADTLSHDGNMVVPGTSGTGLIVTASINIGAAGAVTFTPTDTAFGQLPQNLPLTLSICQTSPATGACTNPASPGSSSTVTVAANETVFFSVFATGKGTQIPYDPANNRVFILGMSGSTLVGEASAAVKMQ